MVKAWREIVAIPTYEIGKPEKNPVFLEKRVYQGSSGAVYPYPVIESISDEKTMHDYHAVYLENEYIKVMILPELGGRVQMAYDKIKQRHFVYYNSVVKPALVGLAGPWISGGIEFNWPQHHRPSTYMPVDCTIVENGDGSVTVWVNEMERMTHQKGMAGFTLRPGCAYLEINGVVYNRTDLPQTFLWWANPAVAVNDNYQSVFPSDINAVFDHGKRAVESFPIATGTYYKMDYTAGVDISNYKNIKVPTSYMAVNSKYNFEGGYENDSHAGMLHVANHHLAPGKKQWTWGNGDFGRAWDRNLTDDDGPYIELMAGVYTENQPDFTWLMPYEEKHFTQYFMPYRELGVVKNASRDFIINLMPEGDDAVKIGVFATSLQTTTVRLVSDDGTEVFSAEVTLSPEDVFEKTVATQGIDFGKLTLCVGDELSWHPEPDEIRPIPDAAEAALAPEDVKTCEQLYLTGLHLEQYRHATYNPVDYYEEALRRDKQDYRCNNALGLWYIRKGRFDLAENYLRTAVKVLMRRNPNPYDGEPIYNLGLALKYQGKLNEAYAMFWKSTWNKGWADAGYLEAAKISVSQNRLKDAEEELNRALINNWHNHKARALKASVLRLLGKIEDLTALFNESLAIDRFNYGCMFEVDLVNGDKNHSGIVELMHGESHNYEELALDYLQAGLCAQALEVLQLAVKVGATSPMTYYYMALAGDDKALALAKNVSPNYCFPNRLEAVLALRYAMKKDVTDSFAPYYLGCLYYDKRQYDIAQDCWELSSRLNPEYPTVWRNLALVYHNKRGATDKAVECMERAFELDTTDARVLMEYDQLLRKLHYDHQYRLELLTKYKKLCDERYDLTLERVTLLNQCNRFAEAKALLDAHIFHPWEGGEGKVPAQYQICRVELAKQALSEKRYGEALDLLKECLEYPHHLGEGKLHGAQENDFYYLMGCALYGLGKHDEAREKWQVASQGNQVPAAAIYYNDAKPDKIFYQGMALRKLGCEDKARGKFNMLVNYGQQHIFEKQKLDYFAVSLPDLLIWDDSLDVKNVIHCKYMLALGYYGLGDDKRAARYLQEVLDADNNHQGAMALASFMKTCN
ncbi:MAG: DUF5107 domain-containing protein [Muribaculaceae bacterium]